jgi:hypothetical protein
MEKGTDSTDFAELLAELDGGDVEHGTVAVKHESEWFLEMNRSRDVWLEHAEAADSSPVHLRHVPDEKLMQLMRAVAEGRFHDVKKESWQPGYPR